MKIPEGMIDTFQPLDYRIFGVLKNQSRSYLNMKIVNDISELFDFEKEELKKKIDPITPTSKIDSVEVLEMAWDQISSELVIEAWQQTLFQHINKIEQVLD